MRVRTTHTGRQLPFERDRRLVLRRLPDGASISRAVLTVSPYSVDESRRFLETLTFPDAVGDWSATKTTTSAAVEIDLRTRRKLASVVGSNLNGPLLVDLGGGFMAVNADGGFGGDTQFDPAAADFVLPGLTVTGLRVTNTDPDISVLRVASPPSNVTIAVEVGPVFFTHFGDLVNPVETPDFSAVLQALLPDLDVVNGHYVVPFVVHSDTIARLDLELDLEFTVAVSATPPGLTSVQTPYRHDGVPATAQGQLALTVPPGMVAVPGRTAGRAQGAFESTRVVYGPVSTPSVPENVLLSPIGPLAQPLLLPGTEVATSIDLLLTAVTTEATVAVDLVDDLDGKPGRTSMLPRVAELSLTRDQAGQPTWVNVPLPGEVEIAGGIRHWVVVQARNGTAAWRAAPVDLALAQSDDPGLQQTGDGGLSWRLVAGTTVPGPLTAQLRLRHVTTTFHMPLELRVGSGDAEVGVSLQRFAPQGAVDLDLGFPEVGAAINTAVTASGQLPSADSEHVANGDFAHWYRIGAVLHGPELLQPAEPGSLTVDAAVAFGPSADTVFLAGRDFEPDRVRFLSFDVFCREQVLDTVIGTGIPTAMTVDRAGRYALVASSDFVDDDQVHELRLVDTSTGRPVGRPIPADERVLHLVSSADGLDVCVLGAQQSETDNDTVVRRVSWAALIAAATGSPLDWDDYPSDTLPGRPQAISAAPDGRLLVLVGSESDSHLHVYPDRAALATGTATEVETIPGPAGVAVVPSGAEVLVLGTVVVTPESGDPEPHDQVWVLRASDLARIATIDLGPGSSGSPCLAIDPTGEICLVAGNRAASVVDVARRTVIGSSPIVTFVTTTALAMSPAGTHAVITGIRTSNVALFTIGDALPTEWELTAGHVQPFCLPGTGEVLAFIGPPASISRQPIVEAAAISQVVPAFGDTRYRYSFD
ncbi:MAG: helix-hairpin-helix domain-containing protein, partial [Acidimicrobiales bacterium]